MKDIIILGATGSIGKMTCEVIKKYHNLFNLIGISVGNNLEEAIKIINEFDIEIVSFKDEKDYENIKNRINKKIITVFKQQGLEDIVTYKKALIVNALSGFVGLKPTINAIKNFQDVRLANKESLVVAGKIVMEEVKKHNVSLLPIDSEHSAIFQALLGEKTSDIKKVYITASGGAFRDIKNMEDMTLKNALKHPNWQMGKKITIDSCTMVNKFFEIVEAHYLFSLEFDKIEAVIHYQSLVHSFIKYKDQNMKAIIAPCDMRIPILYALSYPDRLDFNLNDDLKLEELTFKKIDYEKYPCFKLCLDNFKEGNMGAIINAANEAAVNLFLNELITYKDIYKIISFSINNFKYIKSPTLDEIYLTNDNVYNYIIKNYGGIV